MTKDYIREITEEDIQFVIAGLTSGPGGGKTTLIPHLTQIALKQGIMVFHIPETATWYFSKGVKPEVIFSNQQSSLEMQRAIFRTQILWENEMIAIAKQQAKLQGLKKVLIVCDRTALDALAYMKESDFWRMAADEGFSPKELYARYTLIVCLATAAKGAEEFYTQINTVVGEETPEKARSESPEEARQLDDRIQRIFMSVEGCHYIPNIQDGNRIPFRKKLDDAAAVVMNAFGIPMPIEKEVAHLVMDMTFSEERLRSAVGGDIVKQRITQSYLPSPDPTVEVRIRKIEMLEPFQATYYVRTEKRKQAGVFDRLEKQVLITEEQYLNLYAQRDPLYDDIVKERFYFMYSNTPHEEYRGQIDHILEPPSAEGEFVYEHETVFGNVETHKPPSFLGETRLMSGKVRNNDIAKGANIREVLCT